MGNLSKNLENLKKRVPFGVQPQPSPEAKKKGWERRRMAQEMMNLYDKYMHMTYSDFLAIKESIKNNPEKYTVIEVDMFKYAKNPKFIMDRLDRHISKAPQEVIMGGDMELKITREVIDEPTSEVS